MDAAVGINEEISSITSILLTNPANQNLQYTIGLSHPQKLNILVYDIFGRLKASSVASSNQVLYSGNLDIRALSQGFYLFVVIDENGKKSTTKFLKK